MQGLKLHLDYSGISGCRRDSDSESLDYAKNSDAWASAYSTVAAGAALVAGIGSLGLLTYLKRSS